LYFLLALLLCRICQALVFQTDTVVCSGRTAAGLGAFARRLDYVGGRQRLQYYLGDPPKLVSTPQIGVTSQSFALPRRAASSLRV
jgi:hypothetical protein